MSLPETPTVLESQKVTSTASWMYERIRALPSESPMASVVDSSNTEFPANVIDANGAAVPVGSCRAAADDEAMMRTDSKEYTWGACERQASESPTSSEPFSLPRHEDATARPDSIYHVVRMAALITVRAIRDRRPLSETCTNEEFLQIWTTSWRVPLTRWRQILGIFSWAMVSVVSLSHGGAHERFARTMYMISMASRAVEDWNVFIGASTASMRLQAWLAGGSSAGMEKVHAGGKMVEKHGFLRTGWA